MRIILLSLLLLLLTLAASIFGVALLFSSVVSSDSLTTLAAALLMLAYSILLLILLVRAWYKPTPTLSVIGGYAGIAVVASYMEGYLKVRNTSLSDLLCVGLYAAMVFLAFLTLRALGKRPATHNVVAGGGGSAASAE